MNAKFLSSILAVILFVSTNLFAADLNVDVPAQKPIPLPEPRALVLDEQVDSFTLIQNEIVMLDNLIITTQISLDKQKALKELIEQYNKTQQNTLNNPEDKELLMRTVKMAQRVLGSIQDNNLTHNFDAAFLSELTLLAQIGSKYGEP